MAGVDGGTGSRGSVLQRAKVGLLAAAAWLACRLPEPVIALAAWLIGAAWYLLTPGRAAQARLNLGRVAAHLAAAGAGNASVRAAAADRRRLEALVRGAYRQAVRYYLDMVRVARGTELLPGRLVIETPETVERVLTAGRSVVVVGLHFGALEIPALYLAQRSGRSIVVPMEVLPDPAVQDWLVRTRSQSGVRIVDLAEARSGLAAAIERDEIVGIVGDRDLSGGGVAVPLFGVPARLPIGPALFAIEAGLPVYVGAVRRASGGRWIGRLEAVEVSAEGSRRARLTATLVGLANAFERLITDAPEQWWTLFFPIWDDLVAPGRRAAWREAGGGAGGRSDGPQSAPESAR